MPRGIPKTTSVDPVAQDELVAQIIDMRRCRVPNTEIAQTLGITAHKVSELYRQAMAQNALTAMAIDEYRAEENDLIDALIREMLGIVWNPKMMPRSRIDAALAIDRFMERRAKLLGLDAPVKHEVMTIGGIDAQIQKLEAELASSKRPELPRGHST